MKGHRTPINPPNVLPECMASDNEQTKQYHVEETGSVYGLI